jgi:hypothetical protein
MGILHRDIKPENIFLLRRKDADFVKVVDFGISKSLHTGESEGSTPRLTQTGMVLGTPLYMSPEQARGEEDLDQRIDVYALGVILYEMVTNQVPFQGTNSLSIISRVINEEPRSPRELRPGLSPELEAVILHAMAKDRKRRYASCDALAADLAALLEEVPATTTGRRRLNAPLPGHHGRRPPLPVKIAGLLITASTVAMAGWMIFGSQSAKQAPPPPALPPPAVASVVPAPPAEPAAPPAPPKPAPRKPEKARIEIVSEPSGATVYERGRVRGTTPFYLEVVHEDKDIELVAKLPNHQDTSFRINAAEDAGGKAKVELEKQPSNQRPGSRRPGAATIKPTQPVEQAPAQSPSGTAGGELGGNPYDREGE